MTYVIRLLGLASGFPSTHDGNLVAAYDPDARDGLGEVWSTRVLAEAMTFEDVTQAYAFWTQTSTVRPVRSDGRPNKPLTAFTVSVETPDLPRIFWSGT